MWYYTGAGLCSSLLMIHLIALAVGVTACAIAAWTDISTRKIPNWLTLPLIAGAPLLAGTDGWHALVIAYCILLCAVVLGLQLHGLGLFGGGDVKLLIGVAPLCGFPGCVDMALYTAIAGGILAGGVAIGRREFAIFKTVFSRFAVSIATGRLNTEMAAKSDARIPYALAILVGFSIAALAQNVAPFLRILR